MIGLEPQVFTGVHWEELGLLLCGLYLLVPTKGSVVTGHIFFRNVTPKHVVLEISVGSDSA